MLPADIVAISPDGADAGRWGGISIAAEPVSIERASHGEVEEVVAREANA